MKGLQLTKLEQFEHKNSDHQGWLHGLAARMPHRA